MQDAGRELAQLVEKQSFKKKKNGREKDKEGKKKERKGRRNCTLSELGYDIPLFWLDSA